MKNIKTLNSRWCFKELDVIGFGGRCLQPRGEGGGREVQPPGHHPPRQAEHGEKQDFYFGTKTTL